MRFIRSFVSALMAGGLLAATLCVAPAARAQITGDFTFDDNYKVFFVHGDTTIDGDLTASGPDGVNTDVVVGKDNAANFSTIVSTIPITLHITGAPDGSSGANVDLRGDLIIPSENFYGGVAVYGDHIIHMDGGYVFGLTAHETSIVNVNNGYVPNLYAFDTSVVNVSDGYVDYAIAFNDSALTVDGGSIYSVEGYENGIVTLYGGSVSNATAYDTSYFAISGAATDAVLGKGNSIISMDAGSINTLSLRDNTHADIFGGALNTAELFDDSSLSIYYDLGLNVTAQSSFTEYNDVSKVVIVGTEYLVDGDTIDGNPFSATVKAGDYNDNGLSVDFAAPTIAPDLYVTDPMTVSGAYNSVVIGENKDGTIQTSPTVTLADGSFVRDVYALNASDVTVNGSTINQFAAAYNDSTLTLSNTLAAHALITENAALNIVDNSQVDVVELQNTASATLNSGYVHEVDAFDQSVFTMLGGDVDYIYPQGGTANIEAGTVFNVSADADSKVNITGGDMVFVIGYDQTQMTMSGGAVNSFNVNDDSQASITGGQIKNAYGSVNAILDFSSGVIGQARLRDNAALVMTGGTVADVTLTRGALFAITGGTVSDAVFIYGGLSQALISGAGLTYSITGDWFPQGFAPGYIYSVSGFWNDGAATPFAFLVYSRTTPPTFTGDQNFGTLAFIGAASAPEPATWAMLLIGLLLALAALRRNDNPAPKAVATPARNTRRR